MQEEKEDKGGRRRLREDGLGKGGKGRVEERKGDGEGEGENRELC